jgi:hypothetical protein
MNPFLKYAITSGIVVLVSEAAKRSDRLGAIVGSLPLMTILTLIWLHVERQTDAKITNHAWYTFWYVLPTLPMFALFPTLHQRFGFWGALGASVAITVAAFFVTAVVVKRFGILLA